MTEPFLAPVLDPTPPRRQMLEPLRHQPYQWLVLGRFASFLGNAIAPIALAFAVLDLTGSVASLGLVVGARSLANVALLLFGGIIADRLPRPLVLQGSSYVAGLIQAAVAASILAEFASVPLLVMLGVLNGATAALSMPASAALTSQTVPTDELRKANALLRMVINTALVTGAAAGGTLVALVGPGWGIAVDALTFVIAGLCFSRIRLAMTSGAPRERTRPIADLREGWSEFASRPWVWVVVLQFMIANAAYTGGLNVLGPGIADDTIGRRAWGLVLAALTAGFVAGGFVAMRWQPRHALRAGVVLTAIEAVPLLVLAHAPRVAVLVVALFATGLAMEQFGVAWDVSLQQHIPPERLARVYSYDMLGSFIAIPVGQITVGPLAERYGTTSTLTGAATLIVVATVGALCSRSVRSLTRDGHVSAASPGDAAN
jgi:MFS family permease